jgi:hypothetical protein
VSALWLLCCYASSAGAPRSGGAHLKAAQRAQQLQAALQAPAIQPWQACWQTRRCAHLYLQAGAGTSTWVTGFMMSLHRLTPLGYTLLLHSNGTSCGLVL